MKGGGTPKRGDFCPTRLSTKNSQNDKSIELLPANQTTQNSETPKSAPESALRSALKSVFESALEGSLLAVQH